MDPEVLRLAVNGLTADELDLEALDLDQETLVALQRIQSAAASSHGPQALPAALAQAAHQVAHGKHHKRLRPGGKDSDEDKTPIPTDKASTSMTAAGLGDAPPPDSSTPKSARRSLFSPTAWKQAAQRKHQKTRLRSPGKSPRRHSKTRSQSVPSSPRSWSPPCKPASSSTPAVVDLSGDQSDVDMVDAPSAQDTITESLGKDVGSGAPDNVFDSPDASSPPPQGPPDVVKPSASTISPSPADIRAAEEALREAEEFQLMFGSDDEDDESDNTIPLGKAASSSAAASKTVKVSGQGLPLLKLLHKPPCIQSRLRPFHQLPHQVFLRPTKITATYASVPRRGGAPSVEALPHRVMPGAPPTVQASSTLPPWVLPYLDMELTDAGAKNIERGLVKEAKKVAHDKGLLKVLRNLLKKLFSERDRRAERLRNKYREQYMAWSRDSVSSGSSDPPFIRPELLLDPSTPWYPIENLSFALRTSD
ncbi:hypothetical protein PInf_004628 [Phytophthora infestans]|nr:hypothetical protein PInf_004628 [Phytophthora infestans]